MSQHTATFWLTQIDYTGEQVGETFMFEFNVGGVTHTYVTPLTVGQPVYPNDQLATIDLPVDPTIVPAGVTVTLTAPGSSFHAEGSTTLPVAYLPAMQEWTITALSTNPAVFARFDLRIRADVYEETFTTPKCEELRLLPNYHQDLYAGSATAGFDQLELVVAIGSIVDNFLTVKGDLVTALDIDPALAVPPGSGLLDRFGSSMAVVSSALANYDALSVSLQGSVDQFWGEVTTQMEAYAIIMPGGGVNGESPCDLCKKWMEMLNCLCKLCAQRSTLPPHIRQQLDSILTLVGYLYDRLDGWSTQYGIPISRTPVSSPCTKLARVISFFATVCQDCQRANATLMQSAYSYFAEIEFIFKKLKQNLVTSGITICNPVQPEPPPLQGHCRPYRAMPTAYRMLEEGQIDPAFMTYPSIMTLNQLMQNFEPTRQALVTQIGLAAPLTSPPTGGFFNVMNSTLTVLSAAYMREDLLTDQLRMDRDTFYESFEAGVMQSVALFRGPVGGVISAPCQNCLEWMQMLTCLCYLCFGNSTICDQAIDIETLAQPEINQIYSILAPQTAALGIPTLVIAPKMTTCERVEAIFSILSIMCQRCDSISPALNASLDPYRTTLRAKLDALKGGSLLNCCNICEDQCTGWNRVLNCLSRLCAERASFPAAVISLIQSTFGPLVDKLFWILFPTPPAMPTPPPADPLYGFCWKVQQSLAQIQGVVCATAWANYSMMIKLEILFLDFEFAMATATPQLALFNITTCGDQRCECCLIQSPYIYLQAAGSDQSDGTSPGVHLRWGFLKDLGEKHLPKGNLAAPGAQYYTKIGFNRTNDFVNIYRATYPPAYKANIPTTQVPTSVVETGPTREWIYRNVLVDPPSGMTTVILRFEDVAQYTTVRQTINPMAQPQPFIRAYTGVIQVEAQGKASFAIEIVTALINTGLAGSMKLEAVSQMVNGDKSEPLVTYRKQFIVPAGGGTPTYRVVSENIKYLRLQGGNAYPSIIRVETYTDFYSATKRRNGWLFMKSLSLTTNGTEVDTRLRNLPNNDVNNLWPKYNDGSKVNTTNYTDRWNATSDPGNGLKGAVESYLQLSRTQVKAESELQQQNAFPNDTSTVKISYLDGLKLVALDYHVSRMLGMGHIDATVTSPTQKYIYMAEYLTVSPIDQTVINRTLHIYLSLPTGRPDYRLPITPRLLSPTFGLRIPNGTPEGALITDPDGYVSHEDIRFINLNKEPLKFDQPVGGFFSDTAEFSRDANTRPMMYGVEYKKTTDGAWKKPELSNDEIYKDTGGVHNETVPIPEQANPILMHRETEAGDHVYGIYGINWFSRVSPVDTVQPIVNTTFKQCTLIPPGNVAVQYVQQESPRILTTQDEQTSHIGKTRVTFYWSHQQNIVYRRASPLRKAEYVEFYFRGTEPSVVRGEVLSAVEVAGGLIEVKTKAFDTPSQGENSKVSPEVSVGAEWKYQGSLLVTPKAQFVVDHVGASTATDGAIFFVRPARKNEMAEVDGDNTFLTTDQVVLPEENDRFIVAENFSDPTQGWVKLARKVRVHDFLPLHTETENHPDGTVTELNLGGVHAPATVTHLGEGSYRIEFGSYVLPLHPDLEPDVEWYRGTARIPKANGEKKVLDVFRVETNGVNPLVIHAYDASYDPAQPADAIQTGSVSVNFHPGYRLYLLEELAAGFTAANLMPAAGQGTKFSYIGLASLDTQPDPDCRSAMSSPVMLMARENTPPVQPATPTGPLFATRPDFYGKSSYTFETVVNPGGTLPFALIFFRANERTILDALYEPAQVATILTALEPFGETGFDAGWNELVNVVGTGGQFNQHTHPTEPSLTYRFPLPNRAVRATDPPGYPAFNGSTLTTVAGSGTVADNVKKAINTVFLPLTEQPVIYQFVDPGTETSSKEPVIRDTNGELLSPLDPSFDPFPMARIVTTGTVRFADYTLDGASRNIYFYFAVGMSNKFETSSRSGIIGPVHMVNTFPPEAPVIKEVQSETGNRLLGVPTSVTLKINPYLDSENVKKMRLYRALSLAEAQAVRTMTLVGTFDIDGAMTDMFDDLTFPPFGETIYYRVVALREIINEVDSVQRIEYVPSQASNAAVASVIDSQNPGTPTLTHAVGTSNLPTELVNVTLTWNMTAYNATYYLYRMNRNGNWVKFYQVKPAKGATTASYPPAGGTFVDYPETALLKKEEDGQEIFHRFKVVAENGSGLLSVVESVLTI